MPTTTTSKNETTTGTPSTAGNPRKTCGQTLHPTQDAMNYIREYARQKPDVAALWCFGLGIMVGWKIKPW